MSGYNTYGYDRAHAVAYARRWALSRNPLFYDFTGIGGDCTNFVSQCLLAGCCVMDYEPVFGWYYRSAASRSPSWSGVRYLYDFLTGNAEGPGPFGRAVVQEQLLPGDVVQLGHGDGGFYHTLLVTGAGPEGRLVAVGVGHPGHAVARPVGRPGSVDGILKVYGWRTCPGPMSKRP